MLKDWIPADSSIAIAVENSYVYFHSGYQSVHLEIGQQVLREYCGPSITDSKEQMLY